MANMLNSEFIRLGCQLETLLSERGGLKQPAFKLSEKAVVNNHKGGLIMVPLRELVVGWARR